VKCQNDDDDEDVTADEYTKMKNKVKNQQEQIKYLIKLLVKIEVKNEELTEYIERENQLLELEQKKIKDEVATNEITVQEVIEDEEPVQQVSMFVKKKKQTETEKNPTKKLKKPTEKIKVKIDTSNFIECDENEDPFK